MRFGVVGLGWAARAFHVPALKQLSVGAAGRRRRQRRGAARLLGARDRARDVRSASTSCSNGPPGVDRDRDAARTRTPTSASQALEAGAHVICEKPFVATSRRPTACSRRQRPPGEQVAVNHEFREMPIFRALREQIGGAGLGRLVFCQIWQLMDLAPWDEPVAWRAAMPNRTLFEGGVHLVDLLMRSSARSRSPSTRATRAASSASAAPTRSTSSRSSSRSGRLAQITIDRLCKAGTRYVEVRADCEHASLRASHGGRALCSSARSAPSGPAFGSTSARAGSRGSSAG